VALPTTAGTGSEATPVAVLTDASRAVKVGISSRFLIPQIAIVDPELSASCPPTLTAHSGADALAHCIESFTAIRRAPTDSLAYERVFVGASDLTDRYALAGVGLIATSLLRATRAADDSSREDMATAALFGGLALGSAGTAAAHAIQYPVGALTHTSHGVGVGLLLPYVMEWNQPARIPEFVRLAVALGVLDPARAADGPEDAGLAGLAVDAVSDLLAAIGVPTSLADLGLTEEQLPGVAQLAMGATRLVENNPRPLTLASCELIVRAAFAGDRTLARQELA
jgi:alcohol dehydrogenase